MAQPFMQHSFNSGEWAPALNARVDIAKYHSGAALLRNFFVDYRGGASTRPGTKFIQQTALTTAVRLIPFQASVLVSYILEFGNNYIRFYNNGGPVLESAKTITGITQANPGVITSAAHGYANGDWIYPAAIVGMTQLNANGPYIVAGATANTYTLTDLAGNVISTLAFGAYISGGTTRRVYTLTGSPYLASELAQIKFVQNVNVLIICHPNHPPYQLTLNSATNWTLGQITFGATIAAPSFSATTSSLSSGTVDYGYIVTAVDFSGQESAPSAPTFLVGLQDLRTVLGTNSLFWGQIAGAASYNVYKAELRYGATPPIGSPYGFIGNVTGLSIADSNITPDFSSGPPVIQNPFSGGSVQSVAVTNSGAYTNGQVIPSISFSGGGGIGAAAYASATATSVAIFTVGNRGSLHDIYNFANGLSIIVTAVSGGFPTAIAIIGTGTILSGNSTPISGAAPISWSTFNGTDSGLRISSVWAVNTITLTNPGSSYTSAPTVGVSNGAAAGVAALTPAGNGPPNYGNPTVPALFQQRLFLAGPLGNPQYFTFSQTGAYYNFNVNEPIEADNAIIGNLVSGQLNSIQSAIPMPQGLIILSDKQAWLMNGGSPGSAISPIQLVANSQAYNGASFPPPIVANDNILYVQSKGSIVRDLVFNFYTQVYTGTDISVLSSHLFYGFSILEWAWAEEPFKIVWAVRNDGTLLSLTFLKEQELIAWAHSDTTNGLFKSVATVTESTSIGLVDAVYTVIQRVINGATVQFVERFAERSYPNGVVDAWTVDAGIQYIGAPTANFVGAAYLAGQTVTGLADGVAITPFVMPASGAFTLGAPASKVTIGLGFTAQLQTLAIDLGEPTVQGKRKVIPAVTVRVKDALGLSIGGDFSTLVAMKDLVVGNVGSASNAIVSNLVTNDARTILNSTYTVAGQYCIQQSLPYPASILGVIPEISVGDTAK